MLAAHNVWHDSGDEPIVDLPLTFRSHDQVCADLNAAGLTVTDTRGGWHDEPFEDSSALMVIEARRLDP